MTKYKEYCQNMLRAHQDVFDAFRQVHDKYSLNPSEHQDEFNEHGKPVMELIRDWEDKLCNRSEGSGYGTFTAKLAEKFWDEVRREFPMIDRVGIVVKKMKPIETQPAFELNKISLSDEFNLRKIDY